MTELVAGQLRRTTDGIWAYYDGETWYPAWVETSHNTTTLASLPRITTSAPCLVHKIHHPKSHVNEVHHVWPRGMGGPDVAGNRVVICATGHNNVHKLLDLVVKNNGYPVHNRRPTFFTNGEKELARIGWERIQNKHL